MSEKSGNFPSSRSSYHPVVLILTTLDKDLQSRVLDPIPTRMPAHGFQLDSARNKDCRPLIRVTISPKLRLRSLWYMIISNVLQTTRVKLLSPQDWVRCAQSGTERIDNSACRSCQNTFLSAKLLKAGRSSRLCDSSNN